MSVVGCQSSPPPPPSRASRTRHGSRLPVQMWENCIIIQHMHRRRAGCVTRNRSTDCQCNGGTYGRKTETFTPNQTAGGRLWGVLVALFRTRRTLTYWNWAEEKVKRWCYLRSTSGRRASGVDFHPQQHSLLGNRVSFVPSAGPDNGLHIVNYRHKLITELTRGNIRFSMNCLSESVHGTISSCRHLPSKGG